MSDPAGENDEGFAGEGREGGRPFGGLAIEEGGAGGVEEHDKDGTQILHDEDGTVSDLRERGRGPREGGAEVTALVRDPYFSEVCLQEPYC